MKYVILDLDGCISNDHWRLNRIDNISNDLNKRYHDYHLLGANDPVMNRHLFENFDENTTAAIFTSRPQAYVDQTIDWLNAAGVKYELLCMRQPLDHRPPDVIKREFLSLLPKELIIHAFDDRQDVIDMYRSNGIPASIANYETHLAATSKTSDTTTASDVLSEMAKTFLARNSIYRDNYKMIPKMVAALFPDGVPSELVVEDQWHLFELKLVKLARFAASNLTHIDSIHDDAVYSAMIEAILTNKEQSE